MKWCDGRPPSSLLFLLPAVVVKWSPGLGWLPNSYQNYQTQLSIFSTYMLRATELMKRLSFMDSFVTKTYSWVSLMLLAMNCIKTSQFGPIFSWLRATKVNLKFSCYCDFLAMKEIRRWIRLPYFCRRKRLSIWTQAVLGHLVFRSKKGPDLILLNSINTAAVSFWWKS